MNPTTVDFLREAAIQALRNKQDASAQELLTLIKIAPPPDLKALPSKSQGTIISGPEHGSNFWENYIRQNFIPFMIDNGRHGFTSFELNDWLSNRADIELTAGDVQTLSEGKPVWKKRVSKALSLLKIQGVLQAEDHGKTYQIVMHHQDLLP